MKYMGSKRRIVNDILPIMMKDMNENTAFVDVFCGGCHVVEKVPGCYRRIANDKNNYLITMWSMLVNTGLEFPHTITKETYSHYRSIFNARGFGREKITSDDAMIGWIGFMGSFNGRFFDGGYSGHSVGGRDYISEQIRNTTAQIENLKGVEWNVGDYSELNIPSNSLVYCDIPYKNTKQYSISKDFDYERFYDWCREIKGQGHIVYVSEYWMPDDFTCVWEKPIKTTMNQKKTLNAIEKLYTL